MTQSGHYVYHGVSPFTATSKTAGSSKLRAKINAPSIVATVRIASSRDCLVSPRSYMRSMTLVSQTILDSKKRLVSSATGPRQIANLGAQHTAETHEAVINKRLSISIDISAKKRFRRDGRIVRRAGGRFKQAGSRRGIQGRIRAPLWSRGVNAPRARSDRRRASRCWRRQ